MASQSVSSAGTLFGHRPFAFYFWARTFSEFSYQIAAVAVGWQIYALTNSAFDLGLVGLAQFVPTAALIFIAGHAADRFDRRRIVQICQMIAGLTAAFLAWGSYAGWLNVPEIFGAVAMLGVATAFESPAAAALLPSVAPEGMLQKATATSTAAFQVATISGPALGGFAYVLGAAAPYAAMALFWLFGAVLIGAIALERRAVAEHPPTLQDLFGGITFVRKNPAVLGAISLDLFAVLLGGATALLPIYARDILHTGAWGLGILRGAPAVGAFLMAVVLSRYTLDRRAGLRMFQAVVVFGVATLVFALSHSLWLSVAALAVLGAADTVSMVIRIALVQLTTPDAMRGRVGAVNFLFVNTSYQLGEFESGVTAALFGAVPAAIIGGLGTIAVALLWMKLFPSLRKVERLEEPAPAQPRQ
jgi:MFS family permease